MVNAYFRYVSYPIVPYPIVSYPIVLVTGYIWVHQGILGYSCVILYCMVNTP